MYTPMYYNLGHVEVIFQGILLSRETMVCKSKIVLASYMIVSSIDMVKPACQIEDTCE